EEKAQVEIRANRAEGQVQVLTEEKAQVEIRANRAEGQVQVLTEEKAQVEIRANRAEGQVQVLTTTAEGQIRTFTTQITQKDQSIKTLTTEMNQKQQRIDQLTQENTQKELRIKTLTTEMNQKQQSINTLTREKTQFELRSTTAEGQIIEMQKQITTANNQINDLLIQIRKNLERIIVRPKEIKITFEQTSYDSYINMIQSTAYNIINNKFEGKNDDEGRKLFIKAGIAKALVNIFEKQNSECIKEGHVKAFYALTHPASHDVGLLIYSQSPYEGLFKLLKHTNADISEYAIKSFWSIIAAGAQTTLETVQHPHFDVLATYDGIEQLYQFTLSSNARDDSKNIAAVSIAHLYGEKVIEKTIIRESVINRLKKLVNDSRVWEKKQSRNALILLALNPVNEAEIKKGGFTIPK
ncbi:MAG: hypothetical protein EZS28_043169, partial [Streblomastix strix]